MNRLKVSKVRGREEKREENESQSGVKYTSKRGANDKGKRWKISDYDVEDDNDLFCETVFELCHIRVHSSAKHLWCTIIIIDDKIVIECGGNHGWAFQCFHFQAGNIYTISGNLFELETEKGKKRDEQKCINNTG